MRTEVSLRHLPQTPDLRTVLPRVEEKAERLFARFGRRVQAAEVVVRGGGERNAHDHLCCTVKVALARGKAVVVKATGETPVAAAADALHRAHRVVAERLGALASARHGRRRMRRAAA